MNERLFKAYLTEGKHIGDHAKHWQDLAEEVGIEKSETESMLAGTAFTAEARGNEQEGSLSWHSQASHSSSLIANMESPAPSQRYGSIPRYALKKYGLRKNPLTIVNRSSNRRRLYGWFL